MTGLAYEPGGLWPSENTAAAIEARRWLGTPWKNRVCELGTGIDCLHFIRVVYMAATMLPDFRLPYYHHAIGIREQVNVMEPMFELCCDVEIVDPYAPAQDLDCVLFRCGEQSNHVGVVIDGRLWHARGEIGVESVELDAVDVATVQSFARFNAKGFLTRPETITREMVKDEIQRQRGIVV